MQFWNATQTLWVSVLDMVLWFLAHFFAVLVGRPFWQMRIFCVTMCSCPCKHVQSSVRPCTVVCAIVCGENQFCATMCGRMYERVRPCMAVFEQNICAMMFDCVQ